MLEEKIVHFVEWKKVADEDLAKTLQDVRSWGVTDIVAHPIWYMKDQENKGFLKKVAAMIKDAGLKTPACHALWGKKFDLANEDEAHRTDYASRIAIIALNTSCISTVPSTVLRTPFAE